MSDAISAQGTLIARAPQATPTVFTTIANIMDITLPGLTRNEIDTTAHNDLEESFVLGIRRKTPMTFALGFVPSSASHGVASGLQKAWMDNTRDIYRVTFPDATVWVFSGYISNISATAPIDDMLTADVTIRPTNTMTII